MASEKIMNFEDGNFEAAISGTEAVVLVDFWATWCGPCKAIAPILDELAEEMDGKIQVCKVDIDANKDIAAKFGIRAIPTMLIFKGGEKVDEVVGLVNKADLKTKLESHC